MVTIRSSSSDVMSPALMKMRTNVMLVGIDIPFVEVHICLFADQVGVPTAYSLDLGQRVHDLLLPIDVGVEETEDELEVRFLPRNERYMLSVRS